MYKYLYAPMTSGVQYGTRPLIDSIEEHMADGWELVHVEGSWLTPCMISQRWRVTLYKDSPKVSMWPKVLWQRVYDNYWSRHPEQTTEFQYP